ncbi:hypothetical protein PT974_08550 [Cladobotryum mycophilum]|uniref:Uncharacterized protein n=1 Tax=Cladobotryum mycophilum TaxID=491253 RepID=A0ABR0SDP2_9HYPO
MEARLLDSLHHKLEDLETKIRAYRGDLILDFQRHYHGLLRDVNPDVASNIQRAIVLSLTNYPTLRPELEAAADSRLPPDVNNPGPATFQQAPLPIVPVSASVSARIEPTEGSREREIELQGLFTPSYLPLLDSSPPRLYTPAAAAATAAAAVISVATTTPAPPTTTEPFSPLPETRQSRVGSESDTGTESVVVMDEFLEPSGATSSSAPQVSVDTGLGVRSMTDDSTSSVCSDKSDSKVRRSALRRSSSLSKPPQSPRRVRFEYMGSEVLPTASPRSSEFITSIAPSPFPDDESINSDTILGGDSEDPKPPPRKTSSSDALRALSRTPVEDGTVWTVVNPDAEENVQRRENNNTLLGAPDSMETIVPLNVDKELRTSDMFDGSQIRGLQLDDTNDELEESRSADDSSEEEGDFLAMAKPRASNKSVNPSTTLPSPPKETYNGYTAATGTVNQASANSSVSEEVKDHDASDDEFDDDMFHFEPGGLTAPPKPRQQPPPPKPDEVSDDESHELPSTGTETNQALYATSPAVSIARPPRAEPTSPAVARFQPGSLGSYKGRPVIMPVVKDPEVHARAASLGQFNTFVGGLDGRSGMDEGDLSSFRASVVHTAFTGTPRSFTERLMMEEAQAERMKNKGTTQ